MSYLGMQLIGSKNEANKKMIALVYKDRVNSASGLWTAKLGGDFLDGDVTKSTHMVSNL